MADTDAKGIGIPAGAIPRQDWGGRFWLDRAYHRETNKVITTGRDIFQTVMSLLCDAQEEWMTVRPPSWVNGHPTSDPVPLWPIPDTDKVRTRAIYDSSYSTGPMERFLVRFHVDLGEEARVSHGIDARMLITDGTVLLVMPPDTGLLITDASVVNQYRSFFTATWETSVPFGRPALPPRQAKVLELLAQGHDLDQIADEVGVSKNAVREYAREIRQWLGARTMVQAGALAALRGWVD